MQTIDHFIQDAVAATYITGCGIVFDDLNRWTGALRSSHGVPPATPPDCAEYSIVERRTATLWKDGIKYQINFDRRRVTAAPAADDFVPKMLMPQSDFDALPLQQIDGQPCHEVTAPTAEYMGGTACMWTQRPFAAYLNWPWALRAERSFGVAQKLKQTDTLLSIERNRVLPADTFAIPQGFTVVKP